ncbi:MAG: exosortase family protein XrtF [Flavobacterium sp.]
MKNYWTHYKPFLQFIGVFLASFVGFTFLYQWYLSDFDHGQIDGVTRLVSAHTERVLGWLDANSAVVYHQNAKISILMHQKEVARIIEGCNAVSVIILFVSFVIAFAGKFKTTLVFLLGGSVLIYVLNVLRIAVLSVLLFYFPESEHFLHGVVFPLFIYGVVFILWIVWVNLFSKYAKKSPSA